MTKITSVTDYLNIIQSLEIKNNIFFRGHASESYTLEPGIYRKVKENKTLVEFEDQIFREVISKSPQEFVGKSTLETLALLQHYEAPTRVLDLTGNALVALFFAVSSPLNSENDGEVIVFDIPDKSVCHYNSDRVTILANLSKCEKDFTYFQGLVKIYRDKIMKLEQRKRIKSLAGFFYKEEITSFFDNNSEKIEMLFVEEEDFSLENYAQILNDLQNEYESQNENLTEDELVDFENRFIESLTQILHFSVDHGILHCNDRFFGKLLHNIREDKSYFDAIIDPNHLMQVFAVRPKLDNPRIVRQQGAFLIFGIKEVHFTGFGEYKPMAELNKEWIIKGTNDERIIIDKDSKVKILKELEQLGIDQSTLFPEVDKVADFVRRKFQNKL